MYFNICDPGHISVRDVCICSDHMRKWWNLCHQAATLTYIRAWAHENAVNQYHIRVREADRKLCHHRRNQTHVATKAETIPTPWRNQMNYRWSPTLSSIQNHRDSKTTLIITGIRTDVTTAMWMSMVRYWENVGKMLGECWDDGKSNSSASISAIRLLLQWD